MIRYPELQEAFESLPYQSELYRPTSFWAEASKLLTVQLQEFGVENFRRYPTALSYFVPTYGPPGLGLNSAQIDFLTRAFNDQYQQHQKGRLVLDKYLSGELNALADYRTLLAANPTSDVFGLTSFSEGTIGNPIEQFVFDGRAYSRSSLNYLLGLSLLKRYVKLEEINTVLEIGGGFGTLGEIIGKAPKKDIKYIDIDIPPMNFVAEQYLKGNFGESNVSGFPAFKAGAEIVISSLPSFTVLCPWQLKRLVGKVDLFVNYISFQEMEPHVVENYFSLVKRLSPAWLLLRNMREGKQRGVSGGVGVTQPILSEDYRNMLPNYRLVNISVDPFGYRTVDGFHSETAIFHLDSRAYGRSHAAYLVS